jgi:hypothetical protein
LLRRPRRERAPAARVCRRIPALRRAPAVKKKREKRLTADCARCTTRLRVVRVSFAIVRVKGRTAYLGLRPRPRRGNTLQSMSVRACVRDGWPRTPLQVTFRIFYRGCREGTDGVRPIAPGCTTPARFDICRLPDFFVHRCRPAIQGRRRNLPDASRAREEPAKHCCRASPAEAGNSGRRARTGILVVGSRLFFMKNSFGAEPVGGWSRLRIAT